MSVKIEAIDHEKEKAEEEEETKSQKKARMISIILADIAACTMLLGFTILGPGMYPYMRQVSQILTLI